MFGLNGPFCIYVIVKEIFYSKKTTSRGFSLLFDVYKKYIKIVTNKHILPVCKIAVAIPAM